MKCNALFATSKLSPQSNRHKLLQKHYKNITKTIHYAQPQSKSNMYPYAAGYVYDVPGCIKRTAGVLCRCFKARELPIVVERYVEAA